MEGLFTPTHLIFIMVVLLLLFGGRKLPELGKGLGAGIKEFKEALRSGATETTDKKDEAKKD